MSDFLSRPSAAFQGHRLIAAGALVDVALAVKAAVEKDATASVLAFDDATGRVVDLDLRGTTAEIVSRLAERTTPTSKRNTPERQSDADEQETPRVRGRPKLGVVAREVTLLPRHWDWLAEQPGGASQMLRRLVDAARRGDGGQGRIRVAREAAYHFMSAMAGNLPGFEEAARALFAGDEEGFTQRMAAWPADLSAYAQKLASGAGTMAGETNGGLV
jgi:uncharacterized protein